MNKFIISKSDSSTNKKQKLQTQSDDIDELETSNEISLKSTNCYILDRQLFSVIKDDDKNISAQCQMCTKVTTLVFEYIVEEMRPMVTCEKPSFRRLIKGLSGITENIHLPDRQVMLKELKLKYFSYNCLLTKLISEHNFICTTADIWSCNNKSYLGMTCHFINENTYDRSSYVLGCRRIKGSHTYDNIAEIINEITQTYKINNSKISHTVTDNASNFGKAFRIFSSQSVVPTYSNSSKHSDLERNWYDDSCSDNSDEEVEIEVIAMDSILSSVNYSNEYSLPEHMTCTAHTLNLIATIDTSKISNSSYNKISTATFKKTKFFLESFK
ncbi:hypothetical protein AGLY_011494 [Aphis glycines]|uniref:DUF659 domain-containing protein n=1 Tax=Aphis glycines TaxID=307491 RepID=A0A6G0TDX1_APHGL|nr:hypothetical protein AGLY_011494 [Aphis glycines]